MKFITQNNETVAAASATELVTRLKALSRWDGHISDLDFMDNVSRRIAIEKGVVIVHDTAEKFIAGLLACGVLTEI